MKASTGFKPMRIHPRQAMADSFKTSVQVDLVGERAASCPSSAFS